jgi:carboxyvinyl-carboxyphosphonate phosphorylmutase
MAAVEATYKTLRALRDGTPPSQITGKPSAEFMKDVTRGADYQLWMDEFLGG